MSNRARHHGRPDGLARYLTRHTLYMLSGLEVIAVMAVLGLGSTVHGQQEATPIDAEPPRRRPFEIAEQEAIDIDVKVADRPAAFPCAVAIEPNAVDAQPFPCPQDGPCIEDLRAIQVDYDGRGGTVVCSWKTRGAFDRITVRIEGLDPVVERTIRGVDNLGEPIAGVNLGQLPAGTYRIWLAGVRGDVTSCQRTTIEVQPSSPVPPVRLTRCISYGFDPETKLGFLEVQWEPAADLSEPYVEFEIYVDGLFEGTLDANRDTVTFSRVAEGDYDVEIVAFTRSHSNLRPEAGSAAPARRVCRARFVSPPEAMECNVAKCSENSFTFEVSYASREKHEAVAVWLLDSSGAVDGDSKFLGYFEPAGLDLARQTISVDLRTAGDVPRAGPPLEIANARFANLDGGFEQIFLSNVPGPHTPRLHAFVACDLDPSRCSATPPRFRRGDGDGNGKTEITDGILILMFLFLGVDEPACLDAADTDDNGNLEVTDAIRLLSFLFLGTRSPAAPGASDCGVDPTDTDRYVKCDYTACGP